MSLEDIQNVQNAFISCAERAKQAGFDGVEIIASRLFDLPVPLPSDQPAYDQYGGSFENRTRFAREIIEKMRVRLGRISR
jgi:2,4-dienoyl-CoA reductase (NADPH2)